MARQHARHRRTERAIAQLRRLSHAGSSAAFEIQRRRIPDGDSAAHAELCEPEHSGAPAIAPRRTIDGGAGRSARAGLPGRGRISSHPTWDFEWKMLPRPTGAATRVIYTEYDLPRET